MVYKNKTKINIVFSFLILFVLISVFSFSNNVGMVNAAGNDTRTYTLLEPLPCLGGPGSNCVVGEPIKELQLGGFFQYAFNLLIGLAAVLAVFMVVWGGFEYATSDAWSEKNEGKKKLWNAIIGLLMVLTAFIVLKAVNPSLVAIPKTLPQINIPKPQLESPISLFQRLTDEAAIYKLNYEKSRIAMEEAKSKTADLITDLDDLYIQGQEAINNADEGAILRIEQQIALIDGQIREQQAIAVTELRRSIMAKDLFILTENAVEISELDLDNTKRKIVSQYETGIRQLQNIQNPQDQIQTQRLEDMKAYSLAIIDVQKSALQFEIDFKDASSNKVKNVISALGNAASGAIEGGAIGGNLISTLGVAVTNVVVGNNAMKTEAQKAAYNKLADSVNTNINRTLATVHDPVIKGQLTEMRDIFTRNKFTP